MSTLHGKWSVEDIRKVINSIDEKTGMNGGTIPISLCSSLGDGSILGTYHPSDNHKWRKFSFSSAYFNDDSFKDLAAVDVIRHEYCHYLVDALNLKAVYEDDNDHGIAWKTVCGLLNTDQHGKYREYFFQQATETTLQNALISSDIPIVNIREQICRWGLNLPSMSKRRYLEKRLIKKYTKARVFSINDSVVHNKYGRGKVVDTFPLMNKQLLYVEFEDSNHRVVQNRQVFKMINGEVVKPVYKKR